MHLFAILVFSMETQKRIFVIILSLAIVGAAFLSGTWLGYSSRSQVERVLSVVGKDSPQDLKEVDFDPFWKAWRLVEEKHSGDNPIDRQKLVWGAIEGMVASLGDPYTVFFPPKDHEDFQSEIKGEFSGIGAEIGIRKEILTIIAPLKGSPAERAGLKAGDKILKIDDVFTNDLTLDEAVHKIRGERGTKVTLIISRSKEDKPRTIEVTRDLIRVPVIDAEQKEGGIFVIHLFNFSQNSESEFKGAVQQFVKSGSKKLVLDLRNNPGGYLDASVLIASWFVPEGEVVAREEFRDREPIIYRSVGFKLLEHVPTVVLVNQGSASASEILAGALQEHKKAILMGEKTFGKGSVQEVEEVTGNTSIKITIARWTTPNGKSISKEGLQPDVEVKIPDDANAREGQDVQLEKAIEYLKSH